MKLGNAVSWLMGNLQRSLFPKLEECWQLPLTQKEQRLIALLEMLHVKKMFHTTLFVNVGDARILGTPYLSFFLSPDLNKMIEVKANLSLEIDPLCSQHIKGSTICYRLNLLLIHH